MRNHDQADRNAEGGDRRIAVFNRQVIEHQGRDNEEKTRYHLRGPYREHGFKHVGREREILERPRKILALRGQKQHVINNAGDVCPHESPARARRAHTKNADEQHIQHEVGEYAPQQAVHGLFGIAFGTHQLFQGEHTHPGRGAKEQHGHEPASRFIGGTTGTHQPGERIDEENPRYRQPYAED